MSDNQALSKLTSALIEIRGKNKIEDKDIVYLTNLLAAYTRDPNSTEEARLYVSMELDGIRAKFAEQE